MIIQPADFVSVLFPRWEYSNKHVMNLIFLVPGVNHRVTYIQE